MVPTPEEEGCTSDENSSTPEKNYGSTFKESHENLTFTPKEFRIFLFF